jgi:hypothetical protein
MNLFELLFFLLAIFLSCVFGKYFFGFIGWWGILPGTILGFGFVIGLIVMLKKLPNRPSRKMQEKLRDRKNGD